MLENLFGRFLIKICFWIFKIKSWRVFISLSFFYLFRALIQSLFQFTYPDGYLWEYPGFPSIAVSYLKTNDFFYSGHVGLPVIISCEFFKNSYYYLGFFALLTSGIEFITMIITRGHYIIDLISGIIFAHYTFLLVDNFLQYKKKDTEHTKLNFN